MLTSTISQEKDPLLLDPSAASETTDHEIFLDGLEKWVGLIGTAHSWGRSHLKGRVLQGLKLRPLLFNLYMHSLGLVSCFMYLCYQTTMICSFFAAVQDRSFTVKRFSDEQ